MAAVVGSERAAMEKFGSGGAALLPWTKQMLTVLWEQLRLLLQVIYYTFVSGKSHTMVSGRNLYSLCFPPNRNRNDPS